MKSIATKGQGLEFHSLSCTRGAVTVVSVYLAALMSPPPPPLCTVAAERVHPVMWCVSVRACVCVQPLQCDALMTS